MKIRIAEYKDIERINNIYNQSICSKRSTADTEPISKWERVKWFKSKDMSKYPVYVFEIEDNIVGWISLSSYRNGRKALRYTAEVSYYIDKDFQGKGIGSELLEFIIKICSDLGIKTIFAILMEHNISSIKLLEKHSFKKWGCLPKAADYDGVEYDHLYYGRKI